MHVPKEFDSQTDRPDLHVFDIIPDMDLGMNTALYMA